MSISFSGVDTRLKSDIKPKAAGSSARESISVMLSLKKESGGVEGGYQLAKQSKYIIIKSKSDDKTMKKRNALLISFSLQFISFNGIRAANYAQAAVTTTTTTVARNNNNIK